MFKNIATTTEFDELIKDGAIPIDVRSEAEYSDAKIPNAHTGYDWNSG